MLNFIASSFLEHSNKLFYLKSIFGNTVQNQFSGCFVLGWGFKRYQRSWDYFNFHPAGFIHFA